MVLIVPEELRAAIKDYFERRRRGETASISGTAKDHGVPYGTLRRWIKKLEAGEVKPEDLGLDPSLIRGDGQQINDNPDNDNPGADVVAEEEDHDFLVEEIEKLMDENLEKAVKEVGEPIEPVSVKTVALPRGIYKQLEEDALLALVSTAFMSGYNDVNEFIKREVIPWMRAIKQLELKYMVKLDPDKFIQGFTSLVEGFAELKAKMHAIKKILGGEK